MNCLKIKKVLQEQTLNLFSKDWYETTSLKIAKSIEEIPEPKYGQVLLNFSIKEMQKLHEIFETLEVNKFYTNKEFLPMIKENIISISPKRVKIELMKFAKEKGYYIKEKNVAAVLKWRKNNPESIKKINGDRIKRNIATISNDYVINVLNTYKLGLLKNDIPYILIEVKRELITLRRLIKEKSLQQENSA